MFGMSLRDSAILIFTCCCCIVPVVTLLFLLRFRAFGMLLPVMGIAGGLVTAVGNFFFRRRRDLDASPPRNEVPSRMSIEEMRAQTDAGFGTQLAQPGAQQAAFGAQQAASDDDLFRPDMSSFRPENAAFGQQPPQGQYPPPGFAQGAQTSPQTPSPNTPPMPQDDSSRFGVRDASNSPNRILRDRRYERNAGPDQLPDSSYDPLWSPDVQPPGDRGLPNNASLIAGSPQNAPQGTPPPQGYPPQQPGQQGQSGGQNAPPQGYPPQQPGSYPVRPGGEHGYRIEQGPPGPSYSGQLGRQNAPPQGYPPQQGQQPQQPGQQGQSGRQNAPPQGYPPQQGQQPQQPGQAGPPPDGFPSPNISFDTAPGDPNTPGYTDDDYYGDAGIPGLRNNPRRDTRRRPRSDDEIFGGMLDDDGDGYADF